MRCIKCYYSIDKNTNIEEKPKACWGNLNGQILPTVIYIGKYREKKTEDYIELLVSLINKITKCNIVKVDNKEYIEYHFVGNYDTNLILLNFIRYLWCEYPNDFLRGNSYYEFDTNKFFETLRDDKTYKDALERLLYANQQAVTGTGSRLPPGHSNIHNPKRLKIKTSKQLLEWKGISTQSFLTSD